MTDLAESIGRLKAQVEDLRTAHSKRPEEDREIDDRLDDVEDACRDHEARLSAIESGAVTSKLPAVPGGIGVGGKATIITAVAAFVAAILEYIGVRK